MRDACTTLASRAVALAHHKSRLRLLQLGSLRVPLRSKRRLGLTGLEPVTLRLSSACSNQLSYRPVARLRHRIRFLKQKQSWHYCTGLSSRNVKSIESGQ